MDRILHRALTALCAAMIFFAASALVRAALCVEHDHLSMQQIAMMTMDHQLRMKDHPHHHDGAAGHAQLCCQVDCALYAPLAASSVQPRAQTALSIRTLIGGDLIPAGVGVAPDLDPPRLSA